MSEGFFTGKIMRDHIDWKIVRMRRAIFIFAQSHMVMAKGTDFSSLKVRVW